MPNRSKQKGDREERAIVNDLRALGFEVERTLESGKRSDGSEPVDILLESRIGTLRIECKMRKDGFKTLYNLIDKGSVDVLTLRSNNKKRLYVLTEETMLNLLKE
jgi:Holliday junction resolvase